MSKAFNSEFPRPDRVVHNLGSSGVRDTYPESGVRIGTSGIKFGATVLNNGAAFVFSEDYSYDEDKNSWSLLQKIVPEGINANRQFAQLGSFPEVPFSGAENSRFGSSVAVSRNTRSDSDYCILVGSKNHPFDSGNDLEAIKENKGAAYTYDLMLTARPPIALAPALLAKEAPFDAKPPPILPPILVPTLCIPRPTVLAALVPAALIVLAVVPPLPPETKFNKSLPVSIAF